METEHGDINRSNPTDNISTNDSLDSNRVSDDMELDQDTNKKTSSKNVSHCYRLLLAGYYVYD
jgi:hypothetical protein